MPSDNDLVRRGYVRAMLLVRLNHLNEIVEDAPMLEPARDELKYTLKDLRVIAPDPAAAAAVALAGALVERDDIVRTDWLDVIDDRGSWASRVASLIAAYRAAVAEREK